VLILPDPDSIFIQKLIIRNREIKIAKKDDNNDIIIELEEEVIHQTHSSW
jgi:hypothetical protein